MALGEQSPGPLETLANDSDASLGLNDRVYRRLREGILSGVFRAGDRLNIKPIAAQLGIGLMPVREALGRLSSEGALEALPRSGFLVPRLRTDVFRELLVLRVRLETLAGEYAASRANFDDLKTIVDAHHAMVAVEQNGLQSVLNAHRKFHFAIYNLSGSGFLIQMIENLWLRFGPQVYTSLDREPELFRTAHREILRAMKAGDPTAVSSAIRNDIIDTLGPDDAP